VKTPIDILRIALARNAARDISPQQLVRARRASLQCHIVY